MSKFLNETTILDFSHPSIQQLLMQRGWRELDKYDAVAAVYNFVRDEIVFGYNANDALPASQVLKDGYGQCNTKGNLLMALLRAIGIECRMHGFTIFNELQRGAIPGYLMWAAPARIMHSWVEIRYQRRWLELEGFIIDRAFLAQIQRAHPAWENDFFGFGIATPCLKNPDIDWKGENTYIQHKGIADDFGQFDAPDDFYNRHGTNLKGLRRILFAYAIRHIINRHVNTIRSKGLPEAARLASQQAQV